MADPNAQDRRWALIEMGLIDVQSQPDEIEAVGLDPETYTLLPEQQDEGSE